MGSDIVLGAIVELRMEEAERQAAASAQKIGQMFQQATSRNLERGLPPALNPTQWNAINKEFGMMNQNLAIANTGMGELGERASYLQARLSSFALYRGFVFLEQGIVSSTKAMIALDHEISLVMTQLPNFGKGLRGALTDEVIKVSKKTGETFQEVASALYEISSAGYSGAEAMKALDLSARAAVAGGTSTTAAFQSAFAQLSAFGLGIEKLSEVYDKQFELVKRGIFTYEQLTHIVGVTAEAMEKAGQSIETNNAALATMSEVFTGPQLQRGATALRSFTNAIADSPDKFNKAGIATRDMAGDIRGLIPILEDLKAATSGMATGERASFIAAILPDQREQTALFALLQNMDDLKRNWLEQKLALGSLDKAYDEVHGDIATQAAALKSNLQSGFQPFAHIVGVLAEGLNNVEKVLPGITSSTIVATTAVLAASLAYGKLAQSALAAAEAQGIAAGAPGSGVGAYVGRGLRNPNFLKLGSGVAGLALGGAIEHQTGPSFGGFGGAVAGGAVAGSLGFIAGPEVGVPSVIIGAISSGFSYGINAWRDSSKGAFEDGGKTFGEAFAKSLKDNKGDIVDSLRGALGIVGEGGSKSLGAFESLMGQGLVQTKAAKKRTPFGLPDWVGDALSVFNGGPRPMTPAVNAPADASFRSVYDMASAGEAGLKSSRSQALLQTIAATTHETIDRVMQTAIETIRADAVEKVFGPDASVAKNFASLLVEGNYSLEQFNQLLNDLTEGAASGDYSKLTKDLLAFGDSLGDTTDAMDEMKEAAQMFADAITRNADQINVMKTGAAMQNRNLTAEELDTIKRLEYQNAVLTYQKDTLPQVHAAKGFSGWVNKATRFLVGESGPEHVQVTPSGGSSVPWATGSPGTVGPTGAYIGGGWGAGMGNGPYGEYGGFPVGTSAAGATFDVGASRATGWQGASSQSMFRYAGDFGMLQGAGQKARAQFLAPMGPASDLNLLRSGISNGIFSDSKGYDINQLTLQTARRVSQNMMFSPYNNTGSVNNGALERENGRFMGDTIRAATLSGTIGRMMGQQAGSASRGGQVNYFNFNGPTVPSEMDLTVQQLRRVGPVLVRARGRSR